MGAKTQRQGVPCLRAYQELLAIDKGRDTLDKAILEAQLRHRAGRTIQLRTETFWLFVAAYQKLQELEREKENVDG